MSDYKKMYFTLFHAVEQAVSDLIAAQQACEEIYMNTPEPEGMDFEQKKDEKAGAE